MLMQQEGTSPRAFIDLAKIGRTGWRRDVLTFLLIQLITVALTLAHLVIWTSFPEHRLLRFASPDEFWIAAVVEHAAELFGLWLACRKILRRPFRSLISVDMTFIVRRCLLGAALYLVANLISIVAISLLLSARTGAWVIPFPHINWLHPNGRISTLAASLIAMPFIAFVEELYFRAWLTQTLGRYIHPAIVVVVLVAMLFAHDHTQYGIAGKTLIAVSSLGFSALSLRDRRLELAIGAHAMMNIRATFLLFFAGPVSLAHISTDPDGYVLILIEGGLPLALMYWFLQKTNGWFIPTDDRATNPMLVR
jgi:uncharacterized protein